MVERNTYIAIMHAAAKGKGLHLSAEEVFRLSFDDAIATHAANWLETDEWEPLPGKIKGEPHKPRGWDRIDPYRKRKGMNLAM